MVYPNGLSDEVLQKAKKGQQSEESIAFSGKLKASV